MDIRGRIITVLRWGKKQLCVVKKHFLRIAYFVLRPFQHKKLVMQIEQAERTLTDVRPNVRGTSMGKNQLCRPFQYDLQIIIAAYNVEEYVEACMESVLNQKTKYTYKVIVVEDGSTDGTANILKKYEQDDRVCVIYQQNAGLSAARNTALKKIEASYVMFVDSDDMVAEGAVETLMETAFRMQADIVEGGYYTLYENSLRKELGVGQMQKVCPLKALDGMPARKVFRSELFEDIIFPRGYWFEDTVNMMRVFPKAKSVYKIPERVYIYRMRRDSITHMTKKNAKSLDTYWISELLLQEYAKCGGKREKEYCEMFLRQILINAHRLGDQAESIQKSVFALSAALVDTYFAEDYQEIENSSLYIALKTKDYLAYRWYWRTH
ncbi:MAG: glycosyltransferase family 2 protein [Lachnospiraceae bacterium]|nr:glycosyltransferase family 2 protein [Lachnospiraceae bacterium]